MKTGCRFQQVYILILLCFGFLVSKAVAQPSGTVSGIVIDAHGSVTNATVRIRNTGNFTYTDENGQFLLRSLVEGEQVEVTAWAKGYYIAYSNLTPTATQITLTLRSYHTTDNPQYNWVSPVSGSSEGACGKCHPMILPQWEANGHGGAVSNSRFFSMYNGTNRDGGQEVEPGYLNDFPGTNGNCANCHAPAAGMDGYLTTNMNNVRETITAGIHCDFCHKVGGVYLNPATSSVYPNAPGVISQRVLRPPADDNIFFGPYDDIHDPDTYLPEISQSKFCAPCHQFSFWGTPIYESYDEWLKSSYAQDGVTCQDCHMVPTGDRYFALPEFGGLEHAPESIPSHLQVGVSNTKLMQDAIRMRFLVQWKDNTIKVSVALTNTGAGHHVPTDYPGRNILLLVRAKDDQGNDLGQLDQTKIPKWGGDLAGLPGKGFAKILQDVITKEAPIVNYWRQSLIISDNRIAANETDISNFEFSAPVKSSAVSVTVELRFRRLFWELANAKGWGTPDVIMGKQQIKVFTLPTKLQHLSDRIKNEGTL